MITTKDDHPNAFSKADYRRQPVANTLALQNSILEAARETPQIINSVPLNAGKKSFWLRPVFGSMAFATLLIVVGVGLFDFSLSTNNAPLDAYTESDLQWQELMLIEDELFFAQALN